MKCEAENWVENMLFAAVGDAGSGTPLRAKTGDPG